MRWFTERATSIGFTLALVILILIGALAYDSTVQLIQASEQRARSHETISHLNRLLILLIDAETGQRGYIITGDETYLEPYYAALDMIDTEIEQLRRAALDHDWNDQQMATISTLISQKLDFSEQTIALRTNHGLDAAAFEVQSDRGKELMDSLRQWIGALEANEQANLRQREAAVQTNFQVTQSIIVIGSVLAFLFVLLASLIIRRDVERLRRAEAGLQQAYAILDQRVRERTQELAQANASLSNEIQERRRAEEEVRRFNTELEQRVADRTVLLEAANRELETFSYSVSHDLRAPLRHIDGYSLALLEDYGDQLDTQGQRYLSRVRATSAHMAQLIDDLLQFSRVARSDLHWTEVSLSQMAESIIADLQQSEPDRCVTVHIDPDITAMADPRLIHVVLVNLLSNAWKFTRRREHAQISLQRETDPSGTTVYVVRDNGAGFDMRYAERLFGAFQRLHAQEDFEGNGIGLATIKRIIHRHGGRIWAQSEVDQGAVFSFTLGAPENNDRIQ